MNEMLTQIIVLILKYNVSAYINWVLSKNIFRIWITLLINNNSLIYKCIEANEQYLAAIYCVLC